jgi:hypothetical protein
MSTIDAAIPDRARLTLGETIADSRVMAARQLRKILRRPTYVVYLFVQPVIFVLLFRYVFGGAIDTGDVGYVDYLMPGIITMTAIFGALTTGLGLTEDVAGGAVDRFRSLPIARSAVLIGRTAADLATNAVSLIVMLLIGLAVGFRPSEPVYDVVLAFALVLAFAYVFSWISAFVGLSVRNLETAQSVGFVWSSRSCSPPRRSSPPPACPMRCRPSPTSIRSRGPNSHRLPMIRHGLAASHPTRTARHGVTPAPARPRRASRCGP